MQIRLVDVHVSVCRVEPGESVQLDPERASDRDDVGSVGGFSAVVRTVRETSVVCPIGQEPAGARVEGPWSVIEVVGPLEFSLTGVLASLAVPLADAEVSIFAISTFDTDYVLVKSIDTDRAVAVLTSAGHEFVRDD